MDFENQVDEVLIRAEATAEARRELMAILDLTKAYNGLLDAYMADGDWDTFRASLVKEVNRAIAPMQRHPE